MKTFRNFLEEEYLVKMCKEDKVKRRKEKARFSGGYDYKTRRIG
jgi:hypothetical protein